MANINKFIFGNWKMNMTYNQTESFCKEFNRFVKKDKFLKKTKIQFGVAPTFLGLLPTRSLLKQPTIVGAQNASAIEKGAYTSQVSYSQLKEYNIEYAILGHSEVRQYLGETDKDINNKAIKLINENMIPIICIGESLKEYESKKTIKVLEKQIIEDTKGISAKNASKIIIAYEPLWAIGTGKTPTTDEIQSVCTQIRKILKTIFKDNAEQIHILYGGSLKPENAKSILALKNVDGGLIGGASMIAKSFFDIIKSCPEYIQIEKQNSKK